jgi:hypothetical protein
MTGSTIAAAADTKFCIVDVRQGGSFTSNLNQNPKPYMQSSARRITLGYPFWGYHKEVTWNNKTDVGDAEELPFIIVCVNNITIEHEFTLDLGEDSENLISSGYRSHTTFYVSDWKREDVPCDGVSVRWDYSRYISVRKRVTNYAGTDESVVRNGMIGTRYPNAQTTTVAAFKPMMSATCTPVKGTEAKLSRFKIASPHGEDHWESGSDIDRDYDRLIANGAGYVNLHSDHDHLVNHEVDVDGNADNEVIKAFKDGTKTLDLKVSVDPGDDIKLQGSVWGESADCWRCNSTKFNVSLIGKNGSGEEKYRKKVATISSEGQVHFYSGTYNNDTDGKINFHLEMTRIGDKGYVKGKAIMVNTGEL